MSEIVAAEIVARGAALRDVSGSLRTTGTAELRDLVDAMHGLARDEALADALRESTGLSRAVIEWGLRTTFESLDVARLQGLRAGAPSYETRAFRLAAIVLAGNVFTAGARAILTPLVLGVPTLVKASSRDAVFPQALARALPGTFAQGAHVCVFAGGSEDLERALFTHADVVHAYGSDTSLVSLRRLVPTQTLFVPHGHGVGVAYVDGWEEADVEGLALDVAAYDQRGCLSPMEVLVRGDVDEARRFAQALQQALAALSESLPRGPIDAHRLAAQAQWRGVALAVGELFEGAQHAVALKRDTPLAPGPGGRNLTVIANSSETAAAARWRALGGALKRMGVSRACLKRGNAPRPEGTRPSICALGEMQQPQFDVMADGEPPSHGLLIS